MISSCLQSFSRTQGFTIRHEVTRYMTHVSNLLILDYRETKELLVRRLNLMPVFSGIILCKPLNHKDFIEFTKDVLVS